MGAHTELGFGTSASGLVIIGFLVCHVPFYDACVLAAPKALQPCLDLHLVSCHWDLWRDAFIAHDRLHLK
jgi:hypothetical protein